MNIVMQAWIFIFIVSLFPSCLVGPTYKKPKVHLPHKYDEQQKARTQADLAHWWTFFDDPSLNKLIDRALANNYEMRIVREKIQEARAVFKIQESRLFPEIDAIGGVRRSGYSTQIKAYKQFPSKTMSYFQAGFDVVWELDFWGKLRRAKRAALCEFEAQIENMRDLYIILLGDVARTYVDIRVLQKKIDLLEEQIAVDKKLLLLARERLYAGIDNELPVFDQQAVLHAAMNQKIFLQTLYKQSVIALSILLGENPEGFVLPAGMHVVPVSKKELAIGLPSDLLRRRPDIRRAERMLAAATERVGQAMADWFPSFSLLGSAVAESNTISTWFSRSLSWSIGPSVRWPLITFGRVEFAIKEKESLQRQAILVYAQSVVKALGDVEHWLVAYFNGKKQLHEIKQQLHAITKKRDLMFALLRCGLQNQSDALIAERNRLVAELALIDAEQFISLSLISVYKALGGGW